LVAVAIGLSSAIYLAVLGHSFTDFDHLYAAAKFALAGENPYRLIGPGAQFQSRFPLYYPMPAVLLLVPFALVPLPFARCAFVFVVTSLFGYALAGAKGTRARYLILLSREYVECVTLAHWTPLLFAMWFIPPLNCLAVVKPTVGAAIVGARGTQRVVIWSLAGGLLFSAASFAVQPDWALWWWRAVRSADHFSIPLLRPGGVLLLLALLRWRIPEARLLFALSIPPQTPSFYDPLLFFVVCRTGLEVLILTLAGWTLQLATGLYAPFTSMREAIAVLGSLSIWFLYLPPLLVLLPRPNVGTVPAFVERLASMLPARLRGSPAPAIRAS
jgi:hypothetical protein